MQKNALEQAQKCRSRLDSMSSGIETENNIEKRRTAYAIFFCLNKIIKHYFMSGSSCQCWDI